MKVIIFGSTGSVGKQIVLQALQSRHTVTAFARSIEKLQDIQHPNLKIVNGDVLNFDSVVQAIEEQDAVFCALGAGRKGLVRSQGTFNIIQAMKETGVNRLICQSTLGCGDSWQNLNFFWKRIMFGWFLKEAFKDHQLQEKYVKESNLNWTVVRPGAFTEGKITGNYHHGFSSTDKHIKLKVSRPDVALFMLTQLTTDQYLKQTPGLSY